MQQQKNTDQGGCGYAQCALLGILPLGILTQQLRVMLQRKGYFLQAALDIAADGTGVTPTDIRHHIDVGRDPFVLDDGGCRHHAHSGHIGQARMGAIRLFDPQIADVVKALARFRGAPHHHLKNLLILVEIAYDQP